MDIQSLILNDLNWRKKELTTIKKMPLKSYLNKKEREIVIKYAIPNIYSIWEGFVKFVFRTYINEINTLSLKYEDLNNSVLTHALETKFPQFITGFNRGFSKRCELFDSLFNGLSVPITIDTKLPTKSNINLEVLNDLLSRFNLEKFSKKNYEKDLNNILRIRNAISHGENSVIVEMDDIVDSIEKITCLMDELMLRILDGYRDGSYRKTIECF